MALGSAPARALLFPSIILRSSRDSMGYLPSRRSNCLLPRRRTGQLLTNICTQKKQLPLASSGDVTVVRTEYPESLSSPLHLDHLKSYEVESEEALRENEDGASSCKYFDETKMVRVCDKLIEVFMVDKPTTTEWRRLLAFSREWNNIRPHFYKRCEERASVEDDPEMKHKFLRLRRKLKEIDDDVQRHEELLAVLKEAPSEVDNIVSKRRKDFTKDFFVHLHAVAESYYEDPAEQNALAKLGNTSLAAVQAYDTASESIETLSAAELKFSDIVNSPTLDAACKKIDCLAEKQQLDSTLMLMITKAWSAAKESDMMKDEAKDILYHLYKTAIGNLQRLMPKEIRILKYLLTIKDPEEQLCRLKDAFTPGTELQGKELDYLYTTPAQLHALITNVVDAYHFSGEGSLIREARDLLNPEIIQRLEHLKQLVEKHFL